MIASREQHHLDSAVQVSVNGLCAEVFCGYNREFEGMGQGVISGEPKPFPRGERELQRFPLRLCGESVGTIFQ